MVCTGSARCKNFKQDFVARTIALIAPVQPILHRVSCNNEMVPNTPKRYETHQNMCLSTNGVDQLCSLRTTPTRLHCKTFCINCTMLAHSTPSFVHNEMVPSVPNRYETHKNMSLGSNGVCRVHSLQKFKTRLCGTNFCINCTGSAHFAPSFMQ